MIAVYIIIAIVVVLLILFIGNYNGLVRLRNQVKNAWAQIDVQLKRRYDLIPNLVETVKGYMKHERETLEAVTNARNLAQQMSSAGAGERAKAKAS
jgi:LemA protein